MPYHLGFSEPLAAATTEGIAGEAIIGGAGQGPLGLITRWRRMGARCPRVWRHQRVEPADPRAMVAHEIVDAGHAASRQPSALRLGSPRIRQPVGEHPARHVEVTQLAVLVSRPGPPCAGVGGLSREPGSDAKPRTRSPT